MDRIIHLDGAFVPAADARVSVMDRGFLFADGIYEVSAVLDGRLVDNDAHLARLDRSLEAIGIPNPHTPADWARLQLELVRRNGLVEGVVYIQVTRGAAERDFAPAPDLAPTVVMFTQAKTIVDAPVQARGARVVTRPDLRWARRDIKSVGLLAQVMAKREAAAAGASEVFMVEDGLVTEGGSSTAFIITSQGAVVTRPLSNAVLPGITRLAVMRLAADEGLTLEERAIRVDETYEAEEVFFTSASNFVVPVVSIDGRNIGDGCPGPRTKRLMALYVGLARAGTGSEAAVPGG
ncbi:D-amino-acid transaminase [Lichenibacterium minor]|uniref:Probable branched-chain-amino-acid aminotransferase n=1 Tax=Lichenibacterium minor TaxID=2316528 RepID=A0A4Q2U4C0_9HYPH|nr:D-amino-acid transaminase [Lichenibacterium minor]RYC29811.1 D-amino-acid transaminase [Lichenibacterium minor]